jgi:hypothetical protein
LSKVDHIAKWLELDIDRPALTGQTPVEDGLRTAEDVARVRSSSRKNAAG